MGHVDTPGGVSDLKFKGGALVEGPGGLGEGLSSVLVIPVSPQTQEVRLRPMKFLNLSSSAILIAKTVCGRHWVGGGLRSW